MSEGGLVDDGGRVSCGKRVNGDGGRDDGGRVSWGKRVNGDGGGTIVTE